MTKLNPCPKCGKNEKRTLSVKYLFETRYKVRCSNCGFETGAFEEKEDAHAAWNDCGIKKNAQTAQSKSNDSAENICGFRVGDIVYFDSGHIEKAEILHIFGIQADREAYAKVRCKTTFGTCHQLLSSLHHTEQACRNAMKQESEKIKNQYRKEINTVEDFVAFLFYHCVCGPDAEIEAREIVLEKAEELLSVTRENLESRGAL